MRLERAVCVWGTGMSTRVAHQTGLTDAYYAHRYHSRGSPMTSTHAPTHLTLSASSTRLARSSSNSGRRCISSGTDTWGGGMGRGGVGDGAEDDWSGGKGGERMPCQVIENERPAPKRACPYLHTPIPIRHPSPCSCRAGVRAPGTRWPPPAATRGHLPHGPGSPPAGGRRGWGGER